MDELKFTCPKCAGDRVARIVGTTHMRCRNCTYEDEPKGFKLSKRPSLKWEEARTNYGEVE